MAAGTSIAADAEPETVILAVAAAALGTCEATGSARLAFAAVAAVWALAAGVNVAEPGHGDGGQAQSGRMLSISRSAMTPVVC